MKKLARTLLTLTLAAMFMLPTIAAAPATAKAAAPKTPQVSKAAMKYYIEVDQSNQQVRAYRVYDDGSKVLIRKMICSTGKPSTPTRSGYFLLGQKPRRRFSEFESFPGTWAQYWTHMTSETYFHSILYYSRNTNDVQRHSISNLGRGVSHGCIRMWPADAKWIYDNCQKNTYARSGYFPRSAAREKVNPLITSVKLKYKELTMQTGKSYTVPLTYAPSNAARSFTWTSSDNDVATVSSSGKIVAKEEGTTNIKVTAPHGNKSYTMKLNVQDDPVKGTSLKFEEKELTLEMGETAKVYKPIVQPDTSNEKAEYKSDRKSIATVSKNGTITPVAPGECRIYARLDNGKRAFYRLTVKAKLPTGVSFDDEELVLPVGVKIPLSWVVEPDDATYKDVTFKSSNPAVAKLNGDGLLTTIANGTATVTITTKYGEGSDTLKVIVRSVSVSKLSFAAKTAKLKIGQTYDLKPAIEPQYVSDDTVKYVSSDPNVATVNEKGVVTAIGAGSTTITGTAVLGNKKATCTFTVTP